MRRIPDGQQVKREVDYVLNQCSETMTPMHYHVREMIWVTYSKVPLATLLLEHKTSIFKIIELSYVCVLFDVVVCFCQCRQMQSVGRMAEAEELRMLSVNFLERYLLLIIYNAYLHYVKRHGTIKFSLWLQEVSSHDCVSAAQ